MQKNIFSFFNSLSLSKKVFILAVVSILIVYSAVAIIIYFQIRSKIENYSIETLKRDVYLLKGQIATFDETSKDTAEKFMKIFLSMVTGIKPDNSVCDRFTALTGGSVATIFEKRGDDFLRIATSLKKEDGTRAVGTTLDRAHPAYPSFKG